MGLNFYNATAVKMVDGKPSAVTVQTAATVMENVLTWALAMSATERAGVDLTLTCERISKQSKGAASSAEVQLPAIGLVDNNHSTKPTRRKSCPRNQELPLEAILYPPAPVDVAYSEAELSEPF